MAIVGRVGIKLMNHKDFLRIIKYSNKKFTIDLPQELIDDMILDKKFVEASTEIDVISAFDFKLKEWKESQTNVARIIAFKSGFNGALFTDEYREKINKGEYVPAYKRSGYVDDILKFVKNDDFDGGLNSFLSMKINWAIYDKNIVKDKSSYRFISGRPMGLDGGVWPNKQGVVEIPWTQEREDYFLGLDEAFANMIYKAYQVLGNITPEKLIELTESKTKLIG